MGRKSRLKRQRQLNVLGERLEAGEFDEDPELPWHDTTYFGRIHFRVFTSAMVGLFLALIFSSLWPTWARAEVTAVEASGLFLCGFQIWEAEKVRSHKIATFWFLLGIVIIGLAELWHWRPDLFWEVFQNDASS